MIGIHLSARACFDPTAAVDVFTKLGEAERSMGVETPTFLRTHPLSDVRAPHPQHSLSQQSVSRSVDYTFSSHLGLMRCLTLIVRVSTRHDIQTFTQEPGNIHKIILPKEFLHYW